MMSHIAIPDFLQRSLMMLGEEKVTKLLNANILLVGLGGVGGICAEMLVRSGIGKITIIDADVVETSNRNRQIVALCSTNGISKAKALKARLLDINPNVEVLALEEYLRDARTGEVIKQGAFDYAVDCIDTLSPKVFFIQECVQQGLPVISSMGAGGKVDPTQLCITDISKTYNCTLARYVRKRLGRFGIRKGVKVVFSPEQIDPSLVQVTDDPKNPKKSTIGTISYMPALFGLYCASVVIRDILGQ